MHEPYPVAQLAGRMNGGPQKPVVQTALVAVWRFCFRSQEEPRTSEPEDRATSSLHEKLQTCRLSSTGGYGQWATPQAAINFC